MSARPQRSLTYAEIKATRKPRSWHDSLIDYLLAHPTAPLAELGAEFNRSPAYISIIMHCDAFKTRFEERRRHHSALVHASLTSKLTANLDKSLDIMGEILEKKRGAIPFQQLLDFQDKTLARLGYGASPQGPAVIVNNSTTNQTVSVSADALREAREAIRRSEQARLVEASPTLAQLAPAPEVLEEHSVGLRGEAPVAETLDEAEPPSALNANAPDLS